MEGWRGVSRTEGGRSEAFGAAPLLLSLTLSILQGPILRKLSGAKVDLESDREINIANPSLDGVAKRPRLNVAAKMLPRVLLRALGPMEEGSAPSGTGPVTLPHRCPRGFRGDA